jgi:hypothetical protein
MKRWLVIMFILVLSVIFIVIGRYLGNVPETQHNGATLCLSCIGVGG